jgi:phage shock protein C
MDNRLYRSASDSMIAGVCGGLARFLGIDSTLVRLFFILFTFAGGAGPIVYLILWVIIPKEGIPSTSTMNEAELRARAGQMRDEFVQFTQQPNPQVVKIIGISLVALGVLFLIENLNISWLRWFDSDLLWPALLVFVGVVLLVRAFRGRQS